MKRKPVNNNAKSPKTSKQKGPIKQSEMYMKGDPVWYIGKPGSTKNSFISVKEFELDNPALLNGQLKIDLYVATSENSNHIRTAKKWTSRCVRVGTSSPSKLIGHELLRKFETYKDEEEVEAKFKKHLNREDYQNLLKKFEMVKRVNLEIHDPDEKLEYLTGAKEFKDE